MMNWYENAEAHDMDYEELIALEKDQNKKETSKCFKVVCENWFGEVVKSMICYTVEEAEQVFNCFEMLAHSDEQCLVYQVTR